MKNRGSYRILTLVMVAPLACMGLACGVDEDPVPGVELPDANKADAVNQPINVGSCPGGKAHLVNGRPATWTIIHYAAADNNLEEVITEDINEMEMGHQGSKNVNVIVQLDKYSEEGVWRYKVERDSDMSTLNSKLVGFSAEEPDSGDWHTLAYFGKWAVTCYPADNYIVIIGGHGNGWSASGENDRSSLRSRARHRRARRHGQSLRLIAPDDTDGSEIYIDQLALALKAIQADTRRPNDAAWHNRLVAYGSDACLMETMEVAYELRNAVTYLLGSEETEPFAGWPYNTIIRELTERPSYYATRPHELMNIVVENYGKSYGPGGNAGWTDRLTFAAVDTGAIIKARNRVDKISELLSGLLDEDADLAGLVNGARGGTYTFGDGYADLGQFMTRLRATLVENGKMPEKGDRWDGDERWRTLRETLDGLMEEVWPELVISAMSTDDYPEATGLSIFMPADQCGWGLDLDAYARAPFSGDTLWDELVTKLVVDFGGANNIEEGYGYGYVTLSGMGEHSFGDLSADCELYSGNLYVYSWSEDCETYEEDGDCVYAPEVSFDLAVNGDDMTVTGAYMWSEIPGFEMDTENWDLSVGVSDTNVTAGAYYAGTVQIPFEEDGQTIALTVNFECDEFEVYYCDDYDDWDDYDY